MTAMIVIRAIISWIPDLSPYNNKIVGYIYKITDIILEPIRNLLDRYGALGMIDISPIIALFLLRVARDFLIWIFI